MTMVSEASTAQKKKQIAIYSDDSSVRAAVILALGNRIAEDLPEHEIHEFATGAALRQYIDRKSQDGTFKIDLFILIGFAQLLDMILYFSHYLKYVCYIYVCILLKFFLNLLVRFYLEFEKPL